MSQTWLKAKLLFLALLLAACSSQSQMPRAASQAAQANAPMAALEQSRPSASKPVAPRGREEAKLGTQWGEGLASNVTQVNLRRVSDRPVAVQELHYSATQAKGRALKELTLGDGRIGMTILDAQGRKMTLIQTAEGLRLAGKNGERYQLHYKNYSNNTYSILATVDGLDVLSGQPGSFNSGGYVLPPYGRLTIEGFRKSDAEVAVFRFSSVKNAYAANTPAGHVANVGLIGTAVFELYDPAAKRQASPTGSAFPGQNGYAPAPNYRD